MGWAAAIRGGEGLRAALEAWRNRGTSFSLGVCNGCQLMALLGWLDPTEEKGKGVCSGRGLVSFTVLIVL